MSKKSKKNSAKQSDAADFAAAPVIDISAAAPENPSAAVEVPSVLDQILADSEPAPAPEPEQAAAPEQPAEQPAAAPEPSELERELARLLAENAALKAANAPKAKAASGPVDPKRSEACKRAWDTIRANRALKAAGLPVPTPKKAAAIDAAVLAPKVSAWLSEEESIELTPKTQTVIENPDADATAAA